jgi:hypothetical protein
MYRKMNPKQLEKVILEVKRLKAEKEAKIEKLGGSGNNTEQPILDRCLNGQRRPLVRLN